jgi:hypothetical protein
LTAFPATCVILLSLAGCASQARGTQSSTASNRPVRRPAAAAPTPHSDTQSANGPGALQTVVYPLQPDRTHSRQWGYVDPERVITPSTPVNVRSTGLGTVTLSATVAGAPLEIRVLDNQHVMQPGPAHFQPSRSGTSVSYTFTRSGRPMTCGHTLRLQWRSPIGKQVHLGRAHIVITYTQTPTIAHACT